MAESTNHAQRASGEHSPPRQRVRRRPEANAVAGDDDLLRALKKSPSGPATSSPAIIGAMQRVLGNRSAGQALQRITSRAGLTNPHVQRYREFDQVPATKAYQNGGVGIDGNDESYHFSMNPRGPDSPVANHFNEVHVTFDQALDGEELDWNARPHFYFSDEASPKYIPKEGTAANQRFRREHPDGEEAGNAEFETLKAKSRKVITELIPQLPEYEGKSIPEVQEVHAERLREEEEAAAAKQKQEEAAAAEKLADAEAEKAGKKRLRVGYENSRHKKSNVESYAEQLKTKTGAIAASGNKAQGRGASACTVTLEFGDFKAAKAAITTVGTVKDPGNAEPLTVSIV